MAECALSLSYGDTVMELTEKSEDAEWTAVQGCHAMNTSVFKEALKMARRTPSGKVDAIFYSIEGVLVCHKAWGHFRGVAIDTMKVMHRQLMSGAREWLSSIV